MKKAFSALLPILVIGAIFGAIQYWAVKVREREWWWFHGGRDHMAFADLMKANKRMGHLLIVERDEGAPAMEFEVEWQCNPKRFAWGDGWTKDSNLEQLDRVPVPRSDALLHVPKSPMEQRFVDLACAADHKLARTFRLAANRSPTTLTKEDAFSLVAKGISPPEALQRAR